MKTGLSEQIRTLAKEKYVDPAVRAGRREFSIPVRGILDSLPSPGFGGNRTPQICESIRGAKFLTRNHLQLVRVDGPPSGQSSTVVVHYRLIESAVGGAGQREADVEPNAAERAHRLAKGLKGLLSEEIARRGGAEAFVRWVRSDDEEAA
jgi:hypothetical protein